MNADYALGTTIYIQFTTRAFATGVPTTLSGSPVLSVLEQNNATPITSGVSVSVDRASVTGLNEATIVASGGNGFESGKDYALYISTGTVGGTSVVGEVVGRFSIEKQSALRPTTAGNTLDVTATGGAGIDWGNVENQSTSVNLSATTINLVNTTTTVTNQLTAAQIATGIWQDTTAGDFTVASSIGRSLYTSGTLPGAAGGLFIAGSNAATTIAGLTTGALSCTTITASGAVAFQSTLAITGTTTFAAVALTTLTSSGTVTFNAFTVSGATTLTGVVTATNAGNDIRGVTATVTGTVTLAAAQAFNNTGTWTGNIVGTITTVTGNVVGNVVGSVGSIGISGISAASFNTGAIDSNALAASAVTEIQTGLATSTALNTFSTQALADLVKVLAAVYDTITIAGNVLTLSNGATQTVSAAGRVTA